MKKLLSSRFVIALLATIAIIAIAGGVYFYMQYQNSQRLLKNTSLGGQQQVDVLVGKVGKLIELPSGESPTIATVADVTKLKGQPFFANAKNGFKVLIYTKAKKAILYDPFTDKIVEVAPVNLGNDQATISPTPTAAVFQQSQQALPVSPTAKPSITQ